MARVVVRDVVGDPNEVHSFPAAGFPFDVPNNAFVQAMQDYLEQYALSITGAFTSGLVNHVPVTTPVSNTTDPTDIYSEELLPDRLGTIGLVRRVLPGYISTDDTTPGGLTIDVSYGDTSVNLVQVDDGFMIPSLVKAPFLINIELAAKGNPGFQVLYCNYIQDANVTFLKRLELSEDSTQAKDLKVTVTMTQLGNTIAIDSGG